MCDDNFNTNAAVAICRHIGYEDAVRWTSENMSFVSQTDYEITLDDVDCSSTEWDSCSFSEKHDCTHKEDVFLSCSSEEEGSIGG